MLNAADRGAKARDQGKYNQRTPRDTESGERVHRRWNACGRSRGKEGEGEVPPRSSTTSVSSCSLRRSTSFQADAARAWDQLSMEGYEADLAPSRICTTGSDRSVWGCHCRRVYIASLTTSSVRWRFARWRTRSSNGRSSRLLKPGVRELLGSLPGTNPARRAQCARCSIWDTTRRSASY